MYIHCLTNSNSEVNDMETTTFSPTQTYDLTIAYIRRLIEADRKQSIERQQFMNELCGEMPIETEQQDAAIDLIEGLYAGNRTVMMQFDDDQLEDYAAIFG